MAKINTYAEKVTVVNNDLILMSDSEATGATKNLKYSTISSTVATDLGLGTSSTVDTGITNGTIPLIGAGDVLPTSIMPSLSITDTFTAVSEVAQLALTVQKGDVCVRTDLNKSYINLTGANTVIGDWQELLTPTNAVTSVNGNTGVVVLNADDLANGITNAAITLTQETNFESAFTHSGVITGNPHNVNAEDVLPAQAGQSGKFLTTNGTVSSWGTPAGGGGSITFYSQATEPVITNDAVAYWHNTTDNSAWQLIKFTGFQQIKTQLSTGMTP